MRLVGILVLALLVIAAGAGIVVMRAADKAPEAGTSAPDFTLNSQENKPVSLHDFKGKWVVLYFYPKDFTHGCTIEAHNFQRDLAQYEALNAVLIGVSVDSTNSHQEFCAKQGLTFKLLADTDKTLSKAYGSV